MFKWKENRNYFISDKLEIKESPDKGLGIFAKEDIGANQLIESSHVVLFSNHILNQWAQEQETTHMLVNYTFKWQNAMSALALGFGMMYNHSNEPNARWWPSYAYDDHEKQSPDRMQYFTVRDIKAGEEITIHYAPHQGDLCFGTDGSFGPSGDLTIGEIRKFGQGRGS